MQILSPNARLWLVTSVAVRPAPFPPAAQWKPAKRNAIKCNAHSIQLRSGARTFHVLFRPQDVPWTWRTCFHPRDGPWPWKVVAGKLATGPIRTSKVSPSRMPLALNLSLEIALYSGKRKQEKNKSKPVSPLKSPSDLDFALKNPLGWVNLRRAQSERRRFHPRKCPWP